MGYKQLFGNHWDAVRYVSGRISLKHYDYESIQTSACRHYGRPCGVLGGFVRTVAAHKRVVLIFKTDDLLINKTKFFKFKKYLFPDKRVIVKFKADNLLFNKEADFACHNKPEQFFFLDKAHFLPDASDFAVDSKTSGPVRFKTDFIVFTVKRIAQYGQAG